MSRKLVTLRKVKEIKPIENADNIVLARVDGWQCVVKKGEFNEGDIGIYFEVDSVLPEDNRWGFLERYKWRVKTIKLRGVLSQGLLLPLDKLNLDEAHGIKELGNGSYDKVVSDRMDISDIMGVVKYELPEYKVKGDTGGSFPGFIRKTDQERIQNLEDEYYEDLRFHLYEKTEKLEGTSITIYYYKEIDEFGVCSRNVKKKRSDHPIWNIIDKMDFENVLRSYGKSIAIQGELIGPGIQGNIYKLKEHEFRIFDIWDILKQEYMIPSKRFNTLYEIRELVNYSDDFNVVPVISRFTLGIDNTIDDLLSEAEGKSEINEDVEREGLVYKSVGNPDISFKVINNNYLLGQK